jgi:hypothetical protein
MAAWPNRRNLYIVVVAAWVAAMHWYWRSFVLLLPEHVTPITGPHMRWFATPQAEVATCAQPPRDKPEFFGTGPVSFLQPKSGAIRTVLDSSDHILVMSRDADLAGVWKDGVLSIVDLQTGRSQVEINLPKLPSHMFLLPAARLVLDQYGDVVTAYDLDTGLIRWTQQGIWIPGFHGSDYCGPDLLSVSTAYRNPTTKAFGGTKPPRLINLIDGRFDQRIPLSPTAYAIAGSKDGRYWITGDQGLCTIWDPRTGASLWTSEFFPESIIDFSDASSEICVNYEVDGSVNVARWRASNGEVIDPIPENARPTNSGLRLVGAGHAVRCRFVVTPLELVAPWLAKMGIKLETPWLNYVGELLDRRHGKVLGILPRNGGVLINDADGRGFTYATLDSIAYYRLPPRRNWWWLARWAFAPPALTAVVVLFRQRRRNAISLQLATQAT